MKPAHHAGRRPLSAALTALLVLGLASATLAGQVQLTSGAWDDGRPHWGPNDKIVFESNRNGNYDIFVVNPDGTGLVQLTASTEQERYPKWNKAGTKIAYIRADMSQGGWGQFYLMVMDPDGGNKQTLPLPPAAGAQCTTCWEFEVMGPEWSPDGSQIAFFSYGPDGGAQKVYRYDIATGAVPQVVITNEVNPEGGIERLSWSPDTNLIAFDRWPVGIQTFAPDGSGYRQVTQMTQMDGLTAYPEWMPGGAKILCSRLGVMLGQGTWLTIVNVADGGMRFLDRDADALHHWPSLAPDRRRIVFANGQFGGPFNLFIGWQDGSPAGSFGPIILLN